MLEIYKGIKIEDEVIIVEKQNNEHQGYLVSVNNEKQLENALNWAKTSIWDESLGEEYNKLRYGTPEAEAMRKKYLDSRKDLEGIVHKYKNGQFKLALCESAEKSWIQSGKLSFWNCLITCPDNKTFLIGINSDCLLSLLKNADFIKGVCQSNIWLGRIKNNVGAFTEDMDEFKDGKKDQAMRDAKLTVNYDTIGQIIKTKSDAFVYLGEWYKHFAIYDNRNYSYHSRSDANKYPEFFMVVYSNPKKVYCYDSILTYDKVQYTEEQINDDYLISSDFINNKKKGLLTDEKYNVDINRIISNTIEEKNHYYDDYSEWNKGTCDPERYVKWYKNCNEYSKCPTVLLPGNVFKKRFTQNKEEDLKDLIKEFKARGGEVIYDVDIPKELLDGEIREIF